MTFGIYTYGTRGDVQPYIALALALMEKGHKSASIPTLGDRKPIMNSTRPSMKTRPGSSPGRTVRLPPTTPAASSPPPS